jgi:hypothetical protein
MGSPGLVMSGSKDEGVLLGSIKAQAQPPGRGFLVERRSGSRLIQVAMVEDASAPTRGSHHARTVEPANENGGGNGSAVDMSSGHVASHRRV